MPVILTTRRLRLRPHGADDLGASLLLWADPAVVRFIGGVPATREEAWARLLRYGGLWPLLGYGYWVAERRDTDTFLGEIGFGRFERGLGEDFDRAAEAGWAFMPAAQGQGFAREALMAALAWMDATWPGAGVVCMIRPENERSVRLAERSGFLPMRMAEYKGAVSQLFRRASATERGEEARRMSFSGAPG